MDKSRWNERQLRVVLQRQPNPQPKNKIFIIVVSIFMAKKLFKK